MHTKFETIAAISTPPGRGGIGIIRLSGSDAFSIAKKISTITISSEDLRQLKTRKIIHGYILNDRNEHLDEVLLCFMPANRSFTAEPVVEINCHGGRAVLAMVLKQVLAAGATPAPPGGFTRRAVENGRIDLVQAEAINDVISARSERTLKAALRQVEGGLSNRYKKLREKLIHLLSEIQAKIDFEIADQEIKNNYWKQQLDEIIKIVDNMLTSSKIRKYMDHGLWISLVGAPNAGKSSLFNAVLNIERAIVCDEPGTTRDHLSEVIEVEGIEVKLTDTAGIRQTDSKIESLSIEKTKQQIEASDLIFFIVDQSQEMESKQLEELINDFKDKLVLILNKNDLPQHATVKEFVPDQAIKRISTSTISSQGIDDLLDFIANWINKGISIQEDPIMTTLRQHKLLEQAKGYLNQGTKNIKNTRKLDLLTYDIESAVSCLNEIIGEISHDQVFDAIFNKFCIGK